jgi:hypothetical protein
MAAESSPTLNFQSASKLYVIRPVAAEITPVPSKQINSEKSDFLFIL